MLKKRIEANNREWEKLYLLGRQLEEMKPWKDFADAELVTLEMPDQQRIYVSIMGQGEQTYGAVFYEGMEGLMDFSLNVLAEQMDIPIEYAMFIQDNLTCYWCDREELSREELQLIKELGLKFRGRNKWPQFLSMKEGYFPYLMDQAEVKRMTEYMAALIKAVEAYRENRPAVDYDAFETYVYSFQEESGTWLGSVEILPEQRLGWSVSQLSDLDIQRLKKVKRSRQIIEIDMFFLHAAVEDEDTGRPANVRMVLIADHDTGMVLNIQTVMPGEEASDVMVGAITRYILDRGAPAKIMTRNVMMGSFVQEICSVSDIERVEDWSLPSIDEAMDSFLKMSGVPRF